MSAPLRRFDVFAVWNYVQNRAKGMSDDVAKGDAIWLAKVVAARKFGLVSKEKKKAAQKKMKPGRPSKWKKLSGKPQTASLYDKEIVARMGKTFYTRVFLPRIKKEFRAGRSYQDIRDKIRAELKRK